MKENGKRKRKRRQNLIEEASPPERDYFAEQPYTKGQNEESNIDVIFKNKKYFQDINEEVQ